MNNTFFRNERANFSDGEGNTYEKTAAIINCSLNALLILFAITGNSLVIATILKTPSLRSPSTTLLCGLAVSDLLVGIVVQPLYITKQLKKDDILLWPLYFMSYGCWGVSLWTMTAISLDRFVALHYHMRYVVLVTSRRIVCLMVTAWLIIFLSFGIFRWNRQLCLIIASIFIVSCLLTTSLSYMGIFIVVRRHQLQIHAQHRAVQSSNTSSNLNVMQIKRSTINTFIFYIFLVLCYLPMLILLSIFGIYGENLLEDFKPIFTVLFMNSCINPILYCWRMRDLRKAVLKTGRRMLCLQINQD